MTNDEIVELFHTKIHDKKVVKKSGITKLMAYDYRNRSTVSIGVMLAFLHSVDAIAIIKKDEPTG